MTTAATGVKFRTDIEGLRALAVLPVVLFHAGFAIFPGGYVGVDVFFVISGFLITSSITRDIEASRFSLSRFYEHRIRRLFPAYLLVIVTTALVGTMIMLPADLANLGHSLVGSAIFASNIVFWQQSGDYFGVASELQPLLHTWSLSVEEQFYIGFPLLIMCWRRFLGARSLLLPVIMILLVSFAASVYAADRAPVANFFLLPTRAWELAIGALISIRPPRPFKNKSTAYVLRWLGIAMVLAPVFLFDAGTPVPSWPGLIPTCGAAFVIVSGYHHENAKTVTFLSNEALRFFGKISYSLYLWHWPIMVYARYYFIDLDLNLRLLTVVGSIAIAYITQRFVEKPFRKARAATQRRLLFTQVLALISSVAGVGILLGIGGLPERVPQHVRKLAMKTAYQGPRRDCGGAYREHKRLDELCSLGAARARQSILVVGDSHAEALAAAVFLAAKDASLSGTQLTDTGYRPFLGYEKVGEFDKYRTLNDKLEKLLQARPELRQIVIPFYWQQAVNTDQYVDVGSNSKVAGLTGTWEGLRNLIQRYPNRQFLLVTSGAHSLAFGAAAAARANWYGHYPFVPTVPREKLDEERASYRLLLKDLAKNSNVAILDLSSRLCLQDLCYGRFNGQILYTDDNHLSFYATQLYVADLRSWLNRTRPR